MIDSFEDKCDVCLRVHPTGKLGVCSLPAFPITLAQCPTCLALGAFPIYCLESLVCDEDLGIEETIRKHNQDCTKFVAVWFLESILCLPPVDPEGQLAIGPTYYLTHGEYLEKINARAQR